MKSALINAARLFRERYNFSSLLHAPEFEKEKYLPYKRTRQRLYNRIEYREFARSELAMRAVWPSRAETERRLCKRARTIRAIPPASFAVARANIGIRYQRYKTARTLR